MRVEVVKTLKGSQLWKKGAVFDDTVSLIPAEILNELRLGTDVVAEIKEKPSLEVIEDYETEEAENLTADSETQNETVIESREDLSQQEAKENLNLLIGMYNGKVADVAKEMGFSVSAISLWRKGLRRISESNHDKILGLIEAVKAYDRE